MSSLVFLCDEKLAIIYVKFTYLQIWVNSPHNGSGYFMTGEDTQTEDRFNAKLTTGPSGDMGVQYARTGCLGFIKRTDFTQTDGGKVTLVCISNFLFCFVPQLTVTKVWFCLFYSDICCKRRKPFILTSI